MGIRIAALESPTTATDRQIDNIVYELYGLTPEEIKIVEQDRNEPTSRFDANEESAREETGGAGPDKPDQPAHGAGIPEEWKHKNARRLDLIDKEERGPLTPEEQAEFEELQETVIAELQAILPRPRILDDGRLEKLEAKYSIKPKS